MFKRTIVLCVILSQTESHISSYMNERHTLRTSRTPGRLLEIYRYQT